jgi:hypothetical protein
MISVNVYPRGEARRGERSLLEIICFAFLYESENKEVVGCVSLSIFSVMFRAARVAGMSKSGLLA